MIIKVNKFKIMVIETPINDICKALFIAESSVTSINSPIDDPSRVAVVECFTSNPKKTMIELNKWSNENDKSILIFDADECVEEAVNEVTEENKRRYNLYCELKGE